MLEIFSKSCRTLQDSWNKSRILGGFSKDVRECPSAEIVRKVFQQVTGVVLAIIMDVGEEVVQPLAHIDLRQFAASHKGVDDGSVFGSVMVSAEQVVLAS